MKELSIKEKAKRYDEALEKARKLCTYPTSKPFISDLQELFPELKESEESDGEKIRKHLIILFINDYGKNSNARFAGIKVKDIIAWLEKQNNADKVKQQQSIEIPFGAKDSELQEATYYIPDDYHAEIHDNKVVIKKLKG